MAVRAQTSIEFLLILSAVVLVVLAGLMSLSEITKMQQGAYSTAQSGVQNASSSLLTYMSNQTFGTGFYPVSGGFGNYTNASLVSLELTTNEPYFLNQPAVLQLNAWNNYPDPMQVPKLVILLVNSSGNQTLISPSEDDNVTILASHTITATFIPTNAGFYNVTAIAEDSNGSILTNPTTGQPDVVRTNFTVLDARPPSNGVMKTFNIDKDVVAEMGSTYTETFSLPDDAAIYSAVLEIEDGHMYENKTAGAQATYHYSQIDYFDCSPEGGGNGGGCTFNGVYSTSMFSQQGTVEIPQNSFVTNVAVNLQNVVGTATAFVNGVQTPVTSDNIVHGTNTITLSIVPVYNPPPQSPLGNYGSHIASGDATLKISYYAPSPASSSLSDLMSIRMNNQSPHPPFSVEDVSAYVRPGANNVLQFLNMQGSFHYKLVVNYE